MGNSTEQPAPSYAREFRRKPLASYPLLKEMMRGGIYSRANLKGHDALRGARFSVLRRALARRAGPPQAEARGGTLKRAPRTLNVPLLVRVCMALYQGTASAVPQGRKARGL
jgi:hypothetical protein